MLLNQYFIPKTNSKWTWNNSDIFTNIFFLKLIVQIKEISMKPLCATWQLQHQRGNHLALISCYIMTDHKAFMRQGEAIETGFSSCELISPVTTGQLHSSLYMRIVLTNCTFYSICSWSSVTMNELSQGYDFKLYESIKIPKWPDWRLRRWGVILIC